MAEAKIMGFRIKETGLEFLTVLPETSYVLVLASGPHL